MCPCFLAIKKGARGAMNLTDFCVPFQIKRYCFISATVPVTMKHIPNTKWQRLCKMHSFHETTSEDPQEPKPMLFISYLYFEPSAYFCTQATWPRTLTYLLSRPKGVYGCKKDFFISSSHHWTLKKYLESSHAVHTSFKCYLDCCSVYAPCKSWVQCYQTYGSVSVTLERALRAWMFMRRLLAPQQK